MPNKHELSKNADFYYFDIYKSVRWDPNSPILTVEIFTCKLFKLNRYIYTLSLEPTNILTVSLLCKFILYFAHETYLIWHHVL